MSMTILMRILRSPMTKSDDLGQVFTPLDLAVSMLDDHGYSHASIIAFIREHDRLPVIMEPSFGHGVFFQVLIPRLIDAALSLSWTTQRIADDLESSLDEIELDTLLSRFIVDDILSW